MPVVVYVRLADNIKIVTSQQTLQILWTEPMKDMANTKVYGLFFAVLLATGQTAAGFGMLAAVDGAVKAASLAYHGLLIYRAYSWIRELGSFLLSGPRLKDIPDWFMNNPPYFALEILYFAGQKMLSGEKVEVIKEYSKKQIPCGENTVCNNVWVFLTTVFEEGE